MAKSNNEISTFIRNFRNMLKATAEADANRRTNNIGAGIAKSMAAPKDNAILDRLNKDMIDRSYRIGNTISRKESGINIDPAEFIKTYESGGNLEDLISNNIATAKTTKPSETTEQYAPGTAIDPYSPVTMNADQAAGLQQTTTSSGQSPAEDASDYVEYTYKRGDTFGQVIKDLGLNTKKGLWGSDGDVAFYTKQLREQGIPGMVPIGTKIRLKRRK